MCTALNLSVCMRLYLSVSSVCACMHGGLSGRACWAEETAGGGDIRLGVDIVGY